MKNPRVIFQQQLDNLFIRVYVLPDVLCRADDLSILSDLERCRLGNITHPGLHHQKTWSYVLKRLVLGEVLSVPPKMLLFHDDHGKPRCDQCYFNISHTGNFWAIAWCHDQDVGLDIEQINGQIHWQAIARQFFTKEEQRNIQSLKDFFKLWTQKEAMLKLQGKSIAYLKQTEILPNNMKIYRFSVMPGGLVGCVATWSNKVM